MRGQKIDKLPSWRKAKYVDGPNSDGYFTAGIDAPKKDIFGNPDWHLHAIEFHSKNKAEAIRRRNVVFTLLSITPALLQLTKEDQPCPASTAISRTSSSTST